MLKKRSKSGSGSGGKSSTLMKMHSMSSTVTSKSESVSKHLGIRQLLVSTSLAPVQVVALGIQVCLFITVCVIELMNQAESGHAQKITSALDVCIQFDSMPFDTMLRSYSKELVFC